MRLKRYLQQKAEKDAESLLTESDMQFCMQLASEVQEKSAVAESKKPGIKLWASLGSAIAVALVAVIIIPVALSRKPSSEVHYHGGGVSHTLCQLQDLNADLSCFEVVKREDIQFASELYCDPVSNDKFYYGVCVDAYISRLDLYIVVNKNYNYPYNLSKEALTEQFTGYTLNYVRLNNKEIGDVEAQFEGVIYSDAETVYVEYKHLFDGSEQAFFKDLQSVLKAKN